MPTAISTGRAWLALWGLKVCKSCGEPKAVSEFHEARNVWDGRGAKCRPCASLEAKAYYAANRDKRTAYFAARSDDRKRRSAEWRDRNPERAARYRQDNRDRNRQLRAAWIAEHKQEVLEYNRQWARDNPDKQRRTQQVRRARKRDQYIEHVDPAVLFERDEGICALCTTPVDPNDWWIEHLVPISRGGEHSYANTAVSHPSCNCRKNSKLLSEIDWPLSPPGGLETVGG